MAIVSLIIGVGLLAMIIYFAIHTWSEYFREKHHH